MISLLSRRFWMLRKVEVDRLIELCKGHESDGGPVRLHVAESCCWHMEAYERGAKDGTHILIQFTGGLVQVCYWQADSGWVVAGDPITKVSGDPIAWAEILWEDKNGLVG